MTLFVVAIAAHAVARAEVPAADPDTEIARRHFDRGTALYDDGKYEEAIAEFLAAKKVRPSPAFDYNIARCHDRLEHVREAIDGYQHYLDEAPEAPDAPDVRARVAVLRQRLAEAPSQPTVAAPPPPLPPAAAAAKPPRHRVATWVVGGAGAALLVGSLVAGLVANARYGDLQSNCSSSGACDPAKAPDAQSWMDGGRAAGITSDVLLGVGLAAVAAGVVLFFIEGRHSTEHRAWRVAPAMGPHGGGLALEVWR